MDRGDNAAALEHLEAALAAPGELRSEDLPRGWQSLAEARLQAADAAGDETGARGLRAGALEAATRCAPDPRVGGPCEALREQAGVMLLEMAISGEAGGRVAAAEAITAAWPDGWLAPLATGLTADQVGDRAAAGAAYAAAAEAILRGAAPDSHLALISRFAMLRTRSDVNRLGPAAAGAALDSFHRALRIRARLGSTEVDDALAPAHDIVRSASESMARMETAAGASGATTRARIEWATVLDQVGRFDDATAAWRAAAEADPESFEAAYYWGVHHYNRASPLQDRDPSAFRAELEAARGPLEAAAALRPAEASLRSTLVTLCAVMGDLACMNQYDGPGP